MPRPRPQGVMTMAKIYLTLSNGQVYGVLDTDTRTLSRRAHSTKHFLRRPAAIALDADSYDQHRAQFDLVEVYDLDTQRTYRISARDFDAYRFVVDRGYGRQYAVCLNRWTVIDPHAKPEQLTLLEVGA